jgi:DnaJ-class molecular chaperone
MAKKFASLNYYEMLDLSPDATFNEIRHAYNTAMQVYQTDSLISYSFFSQEERKEILSLLEKAYLTLINEKDRQDYDNELIRLGVMDQTVRKMAAKMPVSIFDINREQGKAGATKNATAELRAKVTENKFIGEIISQQEISGADLKKIRNELALPLEHIAQETKIRLDYLRSIEENNVSTLPAVVFLKGFVKAYLKCLCLEPVDEICTRYMNCLANQEKRE